MFNIRHAQTKDPVGLRIELLPTCTESVFMSFAFICNESSLMATRSNKTYVYVDLGCLRYQPHHFHRSHSLTYCKVSLLHFIAMQIQ